jgi:hypothetical protein
MSEPWTERLERFNGALAEGSNLGFMARDTNLQAEQIACLRGIANEAEALKNIRIGAQDEEGANALLAIQCLADCQIEEMQMWLKLKADQPEEAWAHLVLAQEALGAAYRATKDIKNLDREQSRLLLLEKLLFPPQIFFSTGLLVQGLTCSICGEEYEQCDHIAGQPYWGKFCATIPQKIEPDHAALVDAPADKRCRVAFFSDAGQKRNRMTWALTSEPMADRTITGTLIAATGKWAKMVFTLTMFQDKPAAMLDKPIYGGTTD